MSEFKFSCTQCGQHLSADDSWIGQSIQCPSCKTNLVVPRPAAPPPPLSTASPPPLISKPQPMSAAPMQKPSNAPKVWLIVGIAVACLAVVVIGIGIFGFMFFKTAQRSRAFPPAQQPITINPQPGRPISPQNNLRPKINDPKVTTDPLAAEIPNSPVSGTFGGKDFQVDKASISAVTFDLKQGPDSIIFFLFLKAGEKPDGRKFVVAGKPPPGTPLHIHVHRQGVTFPVGALTENYALRLEFGERQGDKLPGKIFLELPKSFETKIAGTFEATLPR